MADGSDSRSWFARSRSRVALGLTLTARNHGKTSGDVPLAGVPHHAMEGYLAKLIQPLGIRVTRLAYGIPMGSELEYVDEATVNRAVEGRRDL